jgi:hypothetical protein
VKPRKFRFAAMLAIFLAFAVPSVQAIQASATPAPPSPGPAALQNTAGITGGALFGGTVPLLSEQGQLGRKLAIVRVYYMIGQKFNIPKIDTAMAAGSTVLASLDVPHSRGITYASIAAGHQDKQIRAWLTEAEQEAVTHNLSAVYVAFEHEANNPPNHVLGTPAQFQAAWKHMHNLAAKAHLNAGTGGRLRWAMILMHMAYFPASQRPKWSLRAGFASDYFPGAAYVNVIAADGYNRGGCRLHRSTTPTRPSVTPGSLFDPVLTFARTHGGLPVFIAEWASAFYSAVPAWQAHFIGQMKAYVLANPRIAAVSYWDDIGFNGCQFAVTGHPLSVAALASMGKAITGHLG